MILILSHPADDHAGGVLTELSRSGYPATLLDTARFPSNASLTEHFDSKRRHYSFSTDGQRIDLGECRAAWWRRPQPFTLEPGIAPHAAAFSYSECHEAVAGLWAALDIRWVNPPTADETAHHKPYQLAVAAAVGLPIPRTVITNDPEEARRFVSEIRPKQTVFKTFLASEQCWRETRVLRPEEMDVLDRVRLAPVIFQEYVPAVADIRVTVVGKEMFATSISAAPSGYTVDYRMDLAAARFEATRLPQRTKRQLRALMKRLGLVYGAIDLRRTPAGQHVFLEINPAGEWRFVEERTEQPITRAMSQLLIELDEKRR